MSDYSLVLSPQTLLEHAGLGVPQFEGVLKGMFRYWAIDSADLYFQRIYQESLSLEEGIVKSGSFEIAQGVGIRAISGEKTGFAYSEDLDCKALNTAGAAASRIAKQGRSSIQVPGIYSKQPKLLYSDKNPLVSITAQEKLGLLHRIDKLARQLDPTIIQVSANLQAQHETVFIMRHDGLIAADIRPMVQMSISVVAERSGRREQGFANSSERTDYRHFIQEQTTIELAEEAVRQALVNLESIPAPAGTMPVVLGPGWPGVLLHEAVGHGLEGDFNRKGSSAFSGRLGEQVATQGCTVVDNGTLPNHRGSLTIDDEGTPTQYTVLIENGILKGYMQDLFNAQLMGVEPTGNGRRESYASLPIPRMTNTYMLPGPYTPEEIIASVERGLYASNFLGGQVDITSGKFVFSACEAYLIEKGKITQPVKGATLIGNGPDVLTRVSMIGKDFKLSKGGSCGKEGQTIPVSVGQPTLKVDSLTVGGTVPQT